MSAGNAHIRGSMDHPRFHKTPDHPSWSEGVAMSKKFGFRMKYKRFNMRKITDEVSFEE